MASVCTPTLRPHWRIAQGRPTSRLPSQLRGSASLGVVGPSRRTRKFRVSNRTLVVPQGTLSDTVDTAGGGARVEYGNLDEVEARLPFTPEFQKIFLEKYWEKRPLLVRQAVPNFESPVEPEELAGLACDEEVTARLILERGGTQPWEV
eukprot:9481350-Pyramimonas_sp.AAC.1